jgi:hypothetical protein
MSLRNNMRIRVFMISTVVMAVSAMTWVVGQQIERVPIDADDIGGTVTSAKGPEAGVWVVAETTELPTKFARIVVTDDRGRYVLPDLPRATYQVFVRGYGLVDSPRVSAKPGQQLNLKATIAPDAMTAALVYPAAWWLAMVKPPVGLEAQKKFAMDTKECFDCHQLGNKATREILPPMAAGTASTLAAWEKRTRVGPSGPSMGSFFMNFGPARQAYADFTDHVKAGEAPKVAPPRPAGVERNLVISLWDWGSAIDGRSDNVAGDTRIPTANANGPIYGVAEMVDSLTMLDPIENRVRNIKVPTEAPPLVSGFNASPTASPFWGENVWKRAADVRSSAVDQNGRLWMAVRLRELQKQPAFCTSSANKFAAYFPLSRSGRQAARYDQKTAKYEYVDTCFSADHNMFDANNNIYFGMQGAIGWIDVNTWDKTHDAEASQGWCPAVLDTNNDGKITAGWTEPDQPIDPAKDHRIDFGCYSVAVNPKDGSLWCSGIGRGAKRLMRLERGSNPPMTCKAEFFEPPANQPIEVFGSGGVEADHQGLVWQNWRSSGHFSSFDRSRCKTTSDPKGDGQSCPEGWRFYRKADPTFDGSPFLANESYLTHMDVHNVLGLGADAPMYGSVNTDAFEVIQRSTNQFVTLRVPYPLGFFPRSANGRVDDPQAGWKGKGLWASYSTYATWHIEGGRGEGGPGVLPKAVKFQMRPNPLAK